MHTSRCCSANAQVRLPTPAFQANIQALVCSSCQMSLGIVYEEVVYEGTKFLLDKNVPLGSHWSQVASPRHAAIHYVLSQQLYRPDGSGGEVAFDLTDPGDSVKLLWCDRMAVGFYSVKPHGPVSEISSDLDGSGMPTLDTAFILPSHRRLGLGLSMLQDFLISYPGTDVGFSYPISTAMWGVLKKFLEGNEGLRRKFWLIKGNCEEGNKTLIWLCLRRFSTGAVDSKNG